ncbi:hypothetical protein [Nonomuraea angiospora]|uniref:hypothetical protein n=1 Tax=Nonomuraea angiospora TaxID=46172 RepID=UPI0029B82C23|nr:hypothetical protein [Nonomuraea angiospora]MDX3109911.1 hypothetical protein [Nonomuraea angiospora]
MRPAERKAWQCAAGHLHGSPEFRVGQQAVDQLGLAPLAFLRAGLVVLVPDNEAAMPGGLLRQTLAIEVPGRALLPEMDKTVGRERNTYLTDLTDMLDQVHGQFVDVVLIRVGIERLRSQVKDTSADFSSQ